MPQRDSTGRLSTFLRTIGRGGGAFVPRFAPVFAVLFLLLAFVPTGCWKARPIGLMVTLNGPHSEHGRSIRDGAQLYFGQNGARVVVCDDKGTSEGGAACVRALADSGVRVAVGPDISIVGIGAAPEATRRGLLLISPTASTPLLSRMDDLFVRLCPDRGGAEMLARRFASSSASKVVVIFDTANRAYSDPFASAFAAIVRRGGKRVVGTIPFSSGLDLDFKSFLDSLPDSTAVLFIGAGMDLGVFLDAKVRSGKDIDVYSTHWSLGDDLFRIGGAATEGVVIECLPEQYGTSANAEVLRRAFQDRYGYDPSFSAIFGWEAAWLALAVRGASDPFAARQEALRRSGEAPLGWALRLDEFGDPVRSYEACLVREGRVEVLR